MLDLSCLLRLARLSTNFVTASPKTRKTQKYVGLDRGIGGVAFSRVILIGHSYGSFISTEEAITYHDVDALILTGDLHTFHFSHFAQFQGALVPALGASTGYFTTSPGTRGVLFYYAPGSDPDVLGYDEATRQTVTIGELAGFSGGFPDTSQITVPVLLIVGQQDAFYCGPEACDCSTSNSVYQVESAYFSSAAKLQVRVIPNMGHDLNLHLSAPETYSIISGWALSQVAFG